MSWFLRLLGWIPRYDSYGEVYMWLKPQSYKGWTSHTIYVSNGQPTATIPPKPPEGK